MTVVRFQRWLLAALVFTIPLNLFVKFFESQAVTHGLISDYLLVKIYVSDLLLLALLSSWVGESWKNIRAFNFARFTQLQQLILVIFLTLLIRQFFAEYPLVAIEQVVKFALFTWLGWFLYSHSKVWQSQIVTNGLVITLFFQSFLAWYQWIFQRALLPYHFLGESNLSQTFAIAKITIFGAERIVPYGSTPHPNVLGGVVVVLWFLLSLRVSKKDLLFVSVTIASVSALLLTFSISAWLSGVVTALMTFFPVKIKSQFLYPFVLTALIISPVLVTFANTNLFISPSIFRREYLNQAALRMWTDHPIIGVGLQNFAGKVEEYSLQPEVVRFNQPVHHIGLLVLAETGLLGLLLLVFLVHIAKSIVISSIWILLPILCLDHYLLTTQTGCLLFFVCMAGTMISVYDKRE